MLSENQASIDAIIAHEWEESRHGTHEAAVKAGPKTELPVTDGARRILRAMKDIKRGHNEYRRSLLNSAPREKGDIKSGHNEYRRSLLMPSCRVTPAGQFFVVSER
jgi:hypothetical protein